MHKPSKKKNPKKPKKTDIERSSSLKFMQALKYEGIWPFHAYLKISVKEISKREAKCL